VLNEVNEERTVMNTVMRRKINLIGHLLRHNVFITIIMEGKKRVKEPEEDRVSPSLKKSSVGWVVPLTKVSQEDGM